MADNSNYGFKHNLHQKPSETIVRVDWLENMSTAPILLQQKD